MGSPAVLVAAAHPGYPPSIEVIRLTNTARHAAGLPALRTAPRLMRSATAHARDMVARHYWSHAGWAGFITRTGYRLAHYGGGENIARGYTTPAAVFEAWMASPEHRGNILRAEFKAVGVGRCEDIWVCHFGGR